MTCGISPRTMTSKESTSEKTKLHEEAAEMLAKLNYAGAFEKAEILIDQGNYKEAIDILSECVKKNPENQEYMAVLAFLYWTEDQLDAAKNLVNSVKDKINEMKNASLFLKYQEIPSFKIFNKTMDKEEKKKLTQIPEINKIFEDILKKPENYKTYKEKGGSDKLNLCKIVYAMVFKNKAEFAMTLEILQKSDKGKVSDVKIDDLGRIFGEDAVSCLKEEEDGTYTFDYHESLKNIKKDEITVGNETFLISIYFKPGESFFLKTKEKRAPTPASFFNDLNKIVDIEAMKLNEYSRHQSYVVLSNKKSMIELFRKAIDCKLPKSIECVVPVKEGIEKFKRNIVIVVENRSELTVKKTIPRGVDFKYSNSVSRITFNNKDVFIEYWKSQSRLPKKFLIPFFINTSKELLQKYVLGEYNFLTLTDLKEDSSPFFTKEDYDAFITANSPRRQTDQLSSSAPSVLNAFKPSKPPSRPSCSAPFQKVQKIIKDSSSDPLKLYRQVPRKSKEMPDKKVLESQQTKSGTSTQQEPKKPITERAKETLEKHHIMGDLEEVLIEVAFEYEDKLKQINDQDELYKKILEISDIDYEIVDELFLDLTTKEEFEKACNDLLEEKLVQ